jgi:uncharacterized membrane protein YebE (DUF533 family)
MSFGNMIGELLQQGMSSQSRSRLERAVGPRGLGGSGSGGLEQMLGSLLGGQSGGRGSSGSGLGGLMDTARDFLGNKQAGGMTGGQLGGIEALTAPETERLIIRAMIAAAKADGQISQQEMDAILGKIGTEGVTDEERQLVIAELGRPVDIRALAAEVPNEAVAAEVYAASLLAIDIDTEAERDYLRQLAQALGLDAETVAQLHEMTGSPAV